MNTAKLTPTQRFWRLLEPDKKEITNVYVYAIFLGLVNLSLPLGIQAIINLIQGGQVSTSWVVLVAFVVIGIGLAGLFQIYQLRISEDLQQRIFARAAFEFSYRIPRIRMESLYRHYAPELMNRFFDTVSVQKGLSKILIDFSSASIQVIFGLLLLSFYHPFFIAFSLLLMIIVIIFIKYMIPSGMKTSLKESKHKYAVAHWLEEVARTSTTFKLAGDSPLPMQKVDAHVSQYLKARTAHFSILMRHYTLLVVFKVLVALGLLAIGGYLVMEQHMNIGQFVAAELIILLVMNSVEKLILSTETIYDVLTALEKIGQVTDLPLEKTEGVVLCGNDPWKGIEIELQDIYFHYPGGSFDVIQGLDLSINAGERVLITGKNGSGKSTLLQLIAGLYLPQEGQLSYDGYGVGSLNLNELQSVIGDSISQEQLFEGTILENVGMGRKEATMENIQWAFSELGLLEFIKNQENGYESHIDPQGRRLSRSIIQKLILARSIADKPRLLLLEDSFEYLDNQERERIIEFIFNKVHPWTVVVISSSPDELAHVVDRTVAMEYGRIITPSKGSTKS